MYSGNSGSVKLRIHPLMVSFAFASTFVVILCICFNPRWESNDDVAMSMVTHGYGLAAYSSPNLLFSNVLWGYLVRGLPTVHGILGYSLATLAVATLVGTAILYFLARMGVSYLTGLLVLILVLSRPVLFPQFTINAGLLTCAAVLGWLAHVRNHCTFCLVASCILAFLGYLVRSQEFALVLAVALPFLPWQLLGKHRKTQVAFTLLACAIVGALLFDQWSNSGPEWSYYWKLNWARAPFTDFDAESRLLAQPDVMARHGLSRNDVELISSWFFVDRQIADPARLRAIVMELGPTAMTTSFGSGLTAIASLSRPELFPLLVSAVGLLALTFRRRLLMSWVLCLGGLFAMGFVGRPGILRVYIPLLVLLVIVPVAFKPSRSGFGRIAAVSLLAIAGFANADLLIREAHVSDRMVAEAQMSHFIARDSIVMWGSSFPYEFMFPLIGTNSVARSLKMFGLGVSTFAPYSIARAEEEIGKGLIARLQSADGILIAADKQLLKLLGTYCAEHYGTQMNTTVAYESNLWTVYNARCNVPGGPPSG
ncbi:hypothetical protein SAMN05443247_04652 [Bradyrhizobium erythrophlei]|nr:hypothetical protein SAMN05443247_04652 [Bradyrhizobium erythrophlei]